MKRIPEGLRELMSTFPLAGKVEWIGVRPAPRVAMIPLAEVEVLADRGLAGDRGATRARPGHARHITLIQAEHLDAVARLMKRGALDPALVRRNIVVSGINLAALKGWQFRIGGALLEATGDCHPCSLMETQLGMGGYNAMRGHGGINAKIIDAGPIALGDAVTAHTATEHLTA